MTKKRVRINVVLTIVLLVLVALKLIIWYFDGIYEGVFEPARSDDVAYLFLIPLHCGMFLPVLLALITVWLPPKPKIVVGIIALCVSVSVWITEMGTFGLCTPLVLLVDRELPLFAFYPLLTLGVIVVLIIIMVNVKKYKAVDSNYHENTNHY